MPFIKKMIYSGNTLEIEKYPVSKKGSRVPRCSKEKLTKESQAVLNEKNAKKNFIRLVEMNFKKGDLFITLKYRGEAPDGRKLKRDFQNFFARLKYHCKKQSFAEPVYMGVSHDASSRPHHHIILNKYSWDFIKSLWSYGSVQISELEPDPEYGFTAIAKYILNEKNVNTFKKRWCASKNLKKPKIVYKEIKRLSIYKKAEPPKGYKLINVEITDNIFTGMHQYIRCVKIVA